MPRPGVTQDVAESGRDAGVVHRGGVDDRAHRVRKTRRPTAPRSFLRVSSDRSGLSFP